MNTEQGNKLIAEFLQIQKCTDPSHKNDPCYFTHGAYYRAHQFEYHTSWDWLKPVVDEIFTYSLAHPEQIQVFLKMSIVVQILPCWQAVVNFITWLNKEKGAQASVASKAAQSSQR